MLRPCFVNLERLDDEIMLLKSQQQNKQNLGLVRTLPERNTKTMSKRGSIRVRRMPLNTVYKCSKCDFETTSKLSFSHHERSVSFKCSHCSFVTQFRCVLFEHTLTHQPMSDKKTGSENMSKAVSETKTSNQEYFDTGPIFFCHFCRFFCKDKDKLSSHIKATHKLEDNRFGHVHYCSFCNFETLLRIRLMEHYIDFHKMANENVNFATDRLSEITKVMNCSSKTTDSSGKENSIEVSDLRQDAEKIENIQINFEDEVIHVSLKRIDSEISSSDDPNHVIINIKRINNMSDVNPSNDPTIRKSSTILASNFNGNVTSPQINQPSKPTSQFSSFELNSVGKGVYNSSHKGDPGIRIITNALIRLPDEQLQQQKTELSFVSEYNNTNSSETNTDIETTRKEPNTTLKCSHCGFVTLNANLFEEHRIITYYKCPKCPFSTNAKCMIGPHSKGHVTKATKSYVCKECGYMARNEDLLRKHIELHITHVGTFDSNKTKVSNSSKISRRDEKQDIKKMKKYRYICTFCGFVSYSEDKLTEHCASVHNKTKENIVFVMKGKSKANIINSSEDKSNPTNNNNVNTDQVKEPVIELDKLSKCPACGWETTDESEYKQHMQKVSYECEICLFQTISKCLVDPHIQEHLNDWEEPQSPAEKGNNSSAGSPEPIKKLIQKEKELPPFNCQRCEFQGSSKEDLQSHCMVTHRNSCKYTCDVCSNESFSTYAAYFKHMRSEHPNSEIKKYTCPECDYTSTSLNIMYIHYQLKHFGQKEPEELECEKCDFVTSDKATLRKHKLKHKEILKCRLCQFKTINKRNLLRHKVLHMKLDNVGMFRCTKCDFTTKYKKKLLAHRMKHVARLKQMHAARQHRKAMSSL